MSDGALLDVHVVTHTHWDREWYHPAGRFRQRLVELIDELLAAPQREGESFLLDGQAVVLEDYLAVRPDRAAELSRRLAAGAIEAGPWYVLADELIPSGEALVRNLQAGRRLLRALRAAAPPVLYCPDSFGHPAALPVIARGFECQIIILWRGLGARQAPEDTVVWSAPDGTEAFVYHLPRSGYEFGSALPPDDAAAAERWRAIHDELGPRARLRLVLLQNGADHHALQPEHATALVALERAARPHRVVAGSLRAFAVELLRRAHAVKVSGVETMPRIDGELRDSYGYTWTLQGTFGSRAAQKRRSASVERLLLREAEPWSAIVWRRGAPSRRQLLHAAWRSLLLCHPHDTLCGCSIDEVARAMDARLDDAASQAAGIRDDALLDLASHDPVDARVRKHEWRPIVMVRNSAARPRGGIAELDVATFVRDVPVGPGSAPPSSEVAQEPSADALVLENGGIPFQVLGRERRQQRIESPRHYPDNDLVEIARVIAWLPPVPAYGTSALALGSRRRESAELPRVVRVDARSLDNGFLRLEIGKGSALRLTAREHGDIATPLGFEDVSDRGDLYTSSPVGEVRTARLVGARVTVRGPLRGEILTRWRLSVPASLAAGNGRRRTRAVMLELSARLTMDAGSPFLRVRVSGENRARDHRLRVVLGTGISTPTVFADAAFGPVERAPIVPRPEDRAMEAPPATAPMHRYVSLFARERGLTVFGDGLAEYEAREDGRVAITLVRAVGELSRNDLPERPGHAGWPEPTPEAQSLGPFEASFALMPHGPRDRETIDAIERAADDVLLPLTGTTLRSALAMPEPTSGVELRGQGLAFSAAKESEDGTWLALRCVNLVDAEVAGRWCFGFPLSEARLARLDETPLDSLSVDGEGVPFTAPARAVVTVLVR